MPRLQASPSSLVLILSLATLSSSSQLPPASRLAYHASPYSANQRMDDGDSNSNRYTITKDDFETRSGVEDTIDAMFERGFMPEFDFSGFFTKLDAKEEKEEKPSARQHLGEQKEQRNGGRLGES